MNMSFVILTVLHLIVYTCSISRSEPMNEQEHEIVDMIASGYEWWCPGCSTLQNEIEIPPTVECKDCGHIFDTQGANHAYG